MERLTLENILAGPCLPGEKAKMNNEGVVWRSLCLEIFNELVSLLLLEVSLFDLQNNVPTFF